MPNTSAPFMGYFSPTATREAEPDMLAHNMPDMLEHVSRAVARLDPRYRGYIKVLNSAGLRVLEINVLGAIDKPRISLSDADRRQIQDEAQSRGAGGSFNSMTARMLQAEASERAERGEPYDERKGG